MQKGKSRPKHVNSIETVSEHLEAMGDVIAGNDSVIILILSLPENFNYQITILETIAEDKLTWDYVPNSLIQEYDKMQSGSAAGAV